MLSVIDTIGGELSNSYCSVLYADDYWYSHFSTTKKAQWDALDDGQKQQVLIQGTQVIERIRFTIPFQSSVQGDLILDYESGRVVTFLDAESPCKYYYYQRLQFPRNIDVDSSGILFIPEAVKMALCEQALFLLGYDESVQTKILSGVKSESVGLGRGQIQKSTTYTEAGGSGSIAMSPLTWEFLSPLALKQGFTMKRA